MLNRFPAGWDQNRVRRVVDYYENRSDKEAVAEDETVLGEGALLGVSAEPVEEENE